MKESNDNQMELRLRTLSGSSCSASNISNEYPEHLDADEMNAFAEGHVSERTRARYIAHVADCDRCRTIVASLAQAAGVVSQTVAAPKTAAGFWSQLKAFFSPPVLRYAVAALVLAAVVGVSFLALRQQPGSEFVAKNEESSQSNDKNIGAPDNPATATNAVPAPQPSTSTSVAADNSVDERTAKNSPSLSVKPGATPSTGEITLRDSNAAPVASTNSPLGALEPQAAPPPPPKPDTAVVASEVVKEEDEQRQARRRENDKAVSQPGDEDAARGAAPQAGAGVLSGRKVQELPASRRAYELKRKDSGADEEVRSVGGRQFRREGSAWVDTAFSPGRSTTNVVRGSEHYRTLMGDEPGLRSIVEQLGGEVVVIWKGKAYRIR